MQSARTVVVVIPVYKDTLNQNQEISIRRCFSVLGNHPIYLICPPNLNLSQFNFLADQHGIEFKVEYFKQEDFVNIWSYNQLMTSPYLFSRFKEFDYMLIYQDDAYVFRDDLNLWCNSGYDYIGAPWFSGYSGTNEFSDLIGAGNGGLSLRNISKSILVLKRVWRLKAIVNRFYSRRSFRFIPFTMLSTVLARIFSLRLKDISELIGLDKINLHTDYLHSNEDFFWAITVPKYFGDFKVAEPDIAMKFSFENNPRVLFSMTNGELPFGCHAWAKYDPKFWADHIQANTE